MWLFYALGAATIWGFTYAVSEKLLRGGMSPSFLLLISATISFPFYLIVSHRLGTLKAGFNAISGNTGLLCWAIVMGAAVVLANFLIVTSIQAKNASLAALVEISYPVSTVFFTWLILRDIQVNYYTVLGGFIILVGVMTIYLKG